jgi:hypothetical protein
LLTFKTDEKETDENIYRADSKLLEKLQHHYLVIDAIKIRQDKLINIFSIRRALL